MLISKYRQKESAYSGVGCCATNYVGLVWYDWRTSWPNEYTECSAPTARYSRNGKRLRYKRELHVKTEQTPTQKYLRQASVDRINLPVCAWCVPRRIIVFSNSRTVISRHRIFDRDFNFCSFGHGLVVHISVFQKGTTLNGQ